MTRNKKAVEAYGILDGICPREIRFLPKFEEPWQFLFAVIMTAQSTDRRVCEVAPILFLEYATLQSVADADPSDIERIIKSVGFGHSKAVNLVNCAAKLISDHDGSVPSDIDELTKLPGVGRKTANCVAGELFGVPSVIVDTHFGRLMRRLGISDSEDPASVEKDVRNMLAREKLFRFSMCGNWFARNFCKSRKPRCRDCRLSGLCLFSRRAETTA